MSTHLLERPPAAREPRRADDDLLTLRQAAEIVGYTDSAILRKAIRQGRLRVYDNGTYPTLIMVTRRSVRDFLLSVTTHGNRRQSPHPMRQEIAELGLHRCPECRRGWVADEDGDDRCGTCASLKRPRHHSKLLPLPA